MAGIAIANLPAYAPASPTPAVILPLVDPADTSASAQGTTKRMTVSQLFNAPTFTGVVTAPTINATTAYQIGGLNVLTTVAGTSVTLLGPNAVGSGPSITLNSAVNGTATIVAGQLQFMTGGAMRMTAAAFYPGTAGGANLGLVANPWGTAYINSLVLAALSATAVSAGAADSGGAGFRQLLIPN